MLCLLPISLMWMELILQVCVCVCVCACMRACVRVSVITSVRTNCTSFHYTPPHIFTKFVLKLTMLIIILRTSLECSYVMCTIQFCLNTHTPTDQINLTVTKDTMLDCVRMNESTWRKLATEQCVKNGQSHNLDDNTYHNDHVATSDQLKTRVFASLREAVNWCTVDCHGEYYPQNLKDSSIHVQVLVTGSLHLAGAFMSVLDINVDES